MEAESEELRDQHREPDTRTRRDSEEARNKRETSLSEYLEPGRQKE